MAISTKLIQVPIKGLRKQLGPDLLDELETPDCMNVHLVDQDMVNSPGLTDFGPNDDSLKLHLYYDTGDDTNVGLRIGTNNSIKLAQSILTAAAARTDNKITLKLKRNGTITAAKKVYITIEADSTGPAGTPIANGTSADVLCTAISGTAGWITFTFTTAFTLAASTKYWIVLQGDYDVSGTNYIEWEIDNGSSSYTDGDAYIYDSSWATAGTDKDFMFRVYRDETTVMLQDTFYLRGGSSYFMLCTLDRCFRYNGTTGAWVDVSGSLAANLFSGTADDGFCSDTYPGDDIWIVTNYINAVKKWTGSGSLAALANAPRCKFIKVYKDVLFAGYCYADAADQPQLLMWCDTGAMETWTGGASGSKLFYESIDFISGLGLLKDFLVVYKERSIYLGYSVTTRAYFDFDLRLRGVGPANQDLIGELGNMNMFVSWEDIYLFDGTNNTSICSEKVKKEFFATIDPDNFLRSFSLIYEEASEWHIFVPGIGQEHCTIEWIYNYDRGVWFKGSLSTAVTCAGWYVYDSAVAIEDLVGTIDQQTWRLGDRTVSGTVAINLLATTNAEVFKVDYNISEHDGAAVESYVDTKDFTFQNEEGIRIRGHIMEFFMEAAGTSVSLYTSIDEGRTYKFWNTFTLDGYFNLRDYPLRINAEKVRFRLYKNAVGSNFRIRQIGFKVCPGGRL